MRAELFSATQMEQHGRNLAGRHQLSSVFGQDQLLSRLAENEVIIINTCHTLTEAIKSGHQATPAAVWLLDNTYLIEEQIQTAKRHLPKNYSKELPRLLHGDTAGRPRVYDIALETISHGDGRVDPENLRRFISAYQSVSTLKLGELWAVPIMLRLALIENLRRIATRLSITQNNRKLAILWADEMVETADLEPSNLILLVADMSRSHPPLDSAFVAEFVRRLRGQAPTLTLPLNWLSQRLAENGQTIENLVQQESQKQASDQISISNSIGSLRFLTSMNWRTFVEDMSAVEKILRQDPALIYPEMNFTTRDKYRHTIERIAKSSRLTETEIAEMAIHLATQSAAETGLDNRRTHVGYYLLAEGLATLEDATETQFSLKQKAKRILAKSTFRHYTEGIFLLTLGVTGILISPAVADQAPPYFLALFLLCALLMSSQFAVVLLNWLVTNIAAPHHLPRMDFLHGIPKEFSTLVVVPTILIDDTDVESLTEAIEIRFLANRDEQIRFCLLTDFADAATEILYSDSELLHAMKEKIVALNHKYPREAGDYFILLHRPRLWNPQEQVWMSYERKRGKLSSLNHFLRGEEQDTFSVVVGDTSGFDQIRYVITLDTDTVLPRDAASLMISTMAHPLNRPFYDEIKKRVTMGYGILQPRIAVSIPSSDASRYELLLGGDTGIDPYTRTVSDVYQDIFGEGSFVGKGIYDVDMFETALHQCLPENRILSHDLIEGCYIRSGLLSDVQLYEQYPSSYLTDMRRHHRWVRGDWQIAAWIFPKVPYLNEDKNKQGSVQPNSLSALSRWKLLDNLRRSIVPSATLLFLLAGWSFLPTPWFWSNTVFALILLPPLFSLCLTLLRKPKDVLFIQHIKASLADVRRHLAQGLLTFCFLPYEAMLNTDAIFRTLWRINFSHRRLLEWSPSIIGKQNQDNTLFSHLRLMWIGPVLATILLAGFSYTHKNALPAALPLILCWFFSPFLAYWISQPTIRQAKQLLPAQNTYLRLLSRKTWSFFDRYVTAEDNWLPPDNVQLQPVAVIAHRTSPTNIGLSLLANLIAYDFGYLTGGDMLTRTRNTFASLEKMQRHLGHFYNWYDTRTLEPMLPMYVSTVDSGNFSGHLLTLRPGLLEMTDCAIVHPRLFQGLLDTYLLIQLSAKEKTTEDQRDMLRELQMLCAQMPHSFSRIHQHLKKLALGGGHLLNRMEQMPEPVMDRWALAFVLQCQQQLAEIEMLAPWLASPAVTDYIAIYPQLDIVPSLRDLAQLRLQGYASKEQNLSVDQCAQQEANDAALFSAVSEANLQATSRIAQIEKLVQQALRFSEADYAFLYDSTTHLLAIGYNVSDHRRDLSYYDLLASEARLASFIAIAQGQIPQESWFALGRQLTLAGGKPILMSWSGSMFEYLMPLLIMPTYQNTILEETYHAAVERQIQYGQQRSVPWGISESGYNAFDANLNYQYRAFGIPGLGFKRGLGDDLVIAPYASMMALMIEPEQACDNLERLSAQGFEGDFGFFEAIDYTSSRVLRGQSHTVISSYMAHHQGMGFLSLAYLLLDRPLQKRFVSDPVLQATIPLLHERVPLATAHYANTAELADLRSSKLSEEIPLRILSEPNSRIPEVQLLSNGRYHVMVTNAGGSYSRWGDLAVTRWAQDGTKDSSGTFCYVRDIESHRYWSTTYQPTLVAPKNYEVIFSEGRAECRRTDNNIDLHTEIVVSPEDDIELRRTRMVNRSRYRRTIEFTSYAEVVLAPAAADNMHPALSKLFVETEILRDQYAILCKRRPRSESEQVPLMFHLMALHGASADAISYETDRMRFIGRGNDLVHPAAMQNLGALSDTEGSVLDPVVAIRFQITLEPEQTATLDMVTGIAATRESCLRLIEKYQDRHLAERVVDLSWTHSQVVLRQLNISEKDAQLYAILANSVIYVNSLLRANQDILRQNARGQSGLWSYAISGDLPIVLLHISRQDHIDLARQLIQAHAYWRSRGLAVDLVIWNEDHANYRQALQEQITGLISSVTGLDSVERPGGIFVRLLDQISTEDRILFQSVACVVLSDQRGTLSDQLNRRDLLEIRIPALIPVRSRLRSLTNQLPTPVARHLQSDNGLGGFSADGREYIITTDNNQRTPAPWVNVLANPTFGSVISESGQSYTWGENAHEFRLTPWSNDPVTDNSGECFYIRDEDSGKFWSPAALPCRGSGDYVTRHGFGYSTFSHTEDDISSELSVYVAIDSPVKYSVLRISNQSDHPRKLSATGYVEWVLGDLRAKTGMHIVTSIDAASGGICAHNAYNTEFTGRTAFFCTDASTFTVTGDRHEFIGRNGNLQRPQAMGKTRLSGKTGAGFDPCAAIQIAFELAPGQTRNIVFTLGLADQKQQTAQQLIAQLRGSHAADEALIRVHQHWADTLNVVQVTTPDKTLNILANGWLLYQTIACRLWARSGFYQSGGAFGFRDQLQDTMALAHTAHQLARDQILLSAAHQFIEGDVMHWWHPPTQRGVRTHCSDDYLWLPFAVARYVHNTDDSGILDVQVAYIEGRAVSPEEDSYYDLPTHSLHSASIYDHCVRAIRHGMRFGTHDLPLIGSCDWNDGMDKVGAQGKGESVWLGFFLHQVLNEFADIALLREDAAFAEQCKTQAITLARNIDLQAWDGAWYRRAYFDDGTPLGSHENIECQIDSISQSWSVLSGCGTQEHRQQAMQSLHERLVQKDDGLILLLDPPFNQSGKNPGYISGYVPGVRENGGQYTHAAIWAAMAFAKMGDTAKAWEAFDIVNPLRHADTPANIARYKVEPYVIAADVYGVAPHTGRGGWTWYTGSAGWMYTLIVESLLGLQRHGHFLTISPCIPASWDGFEIHYQFGLSMYHISIRVSQESNASASMSLDKQPSEDLRIALIDDGAVHQVVYQLSRPGESQSDSLSPP